MPGVTGCVLQMNLLLKEYILSGDGEEAERCLRDLEVPHFHHEFVYEVKKQPPPCQVLTALAVLGKVPFQAEPLSL